MDCIFRRPETEAGFGNFKMGLRWFFANSRVLVPEGLNPVCPEYRLCGAGCARQNLVDSQSTANVDSKAPKSACGRVIPDRSDY